MLTAIQLQQQRRVSLVELPGFGAEERLKWATELRQIVTHLRMAHLLVAQVRGSIA